VCLDGNVFAPINLPENITSPRRPLHMIKVADHPISKRTMSHALRTMCWAQLMEKALLSFLPNDIHMIFWILIIFDVFTSAAKFY
jgi:hypothetical protein